ncbi:MAG: hypothetical protein PWP71_2171 [Clostridia bacterium]|jgi:hypothetical protein|nr:hypothetical protein [Clostridia bacterium]
MKIPFLVLILQGIPEQIGIVALAFAIAKIPFNSKNIVLWGVVLATSAFIIRSLPITFGVHTVVLIGMLYFILNIFEKIDVNISILASLLSYLALIISETLFVPLLMYIFKISRDILLSNIPIRIMITLPHVIVIFLLAFIIKNIRK